MTCPQFGEADRRSTAVEATSFSLLKNGNLAVSAVRQPFKQETVASIDALIKATKR